MGCGGIAYLIDGFHRSIDRGVKSNGIIGTGDIKVNGSRQTYGIDSKPRQFGSAIKGTITADDNQSFDAMFSAYLCPQLLSLFCTEFLTPRGIKDGSASLYDIRNTAAVHIHDFFLQKSGIATFNAFYFHVL